MRSFHFYPQLDAMDCGPACLQMIAKFHGKFYPLPWLREESHLTREGVSLKGIGAAAEKMGLRTLAVKVPFKDQNNAPSLDKAPLPLIAFWNNNHFVVVYRIDRRNVWVADPARGKLKIPRAEFEESWRGKSEAGVALLVEPGITFYDNDPPATARLSWNYLVAYLRPYKKLGIQLLLGLVLSSLFSLVFPFLTQAIVDTGIQNQDIDFIYLILIGQLVLFASATAVSFIQSWILLHIGVRMNVALISDFLAKLMRLPIGFFDAKMTGDLLQRIGDHRRIESFLTNSTLSIVLSIFNLLVFSFVLLYYSSMIFFVFALASILYFVWILFFLKKRKQIDQRAFQQMSRNQNSLIEIIQGMPEIKLQGSQLKRRWLWAEIQAKLFRIQMSSLKIGQYQEAGALFISQTKDIVITVIAATAVIKGTLTLGMMLAIQYIIGQLNGPLQQMIRFIQSAQDAKISADRLGEIHEQNNEEDETADLTPPKQRDINFEHVSYRYSQISDDVLQDISFTIPHGKVTAIVGASGSGKTTLLKLLLGFYNPTKGRVKVGGIDLQNVDRQRWRDNCGVVMQDGFIFSDTIANNICESDDRPDFLKLARAVYTANIENYIDNLPLGFKTTIGARGSGLSHGQKQRLLIARAVYKDPDIILFDEATNSLDANNESIIVNRLNEFFVGRTVVIVAHRLSTVSFADQIIVLDKGSIVEHGNHQELIAQRGAYYTLVKNQLELGQ